MFADPDDWERDGAYRLVQLDSGHWLAVTPTDKESPIHWSKTEIRRWIKWHRKVGDRGAFVGGDSQHSLETQKLGEQS